jgi:peptidoglycan/xylan/chitin deacetylase (PgdA/CDA1 family)
MVLLYAAVGILILLLVYGILEQGFLVPEKKGLPILMYHKVIPGTPDWLTVTPEQLDKQLAWLKARGYETITFNDLKEFSENRKKLPRRPIILTFDDAFLNFLTDALPILKKHGMQATNFVPVSFIGKINEWDKGSLPIMTAEQLREAAAAGTSLGLHSYAHGNYNDMDAEAIRHDLTSCILHLTSLSIPFVPVLAYPYGAYPKRDPGRFGLMTEVFREMKIDFAVRIGNRVNKLPVPEPYTLFRIDIRGNESFRTFRIKVKKGRKKLFS